MKKSLIVFTFAALSALIGALSNVPQVAAQFSSSFGLTPTATNRIPYALNSGYYGNSASLTYTPGTTTLAVPNITISGTVTLTNPLPATAGGTGTGTVAAGDLLYGSGVNTWGKLAAGTNTHVLTLAAGVPTWAAPTTSTLAIGTPITGGGANRVLFESAANALAQNANINVDATNSQLQLDALTSSAGLRVGGSGKGQVWYRDSGGTEGVALTAPGVVAVGGNASSWFRVGLNIADPVNSLTTAQFYVNGTTAALQHQAGGTAQLSWVSAGSEYNRIQSRTTDSDLEIPKGLRIGYQISPNGFWPNIATATNATSPWTFRYQSAAPFDTTVLADTSGGNVTITLPGSPENGTMAFIKKITTDANTLTVGRNGNNIEGAAADFTTAAVNLPARIFQFRTGSGWWIVGGYN